MDIKVIEQDKNAIQRLNFCIEERIGCEIILASKYDDFYKDGNIEKYKITTEDGIKDGDEIILWPQYSHGGKAIVKESNNEFYAIVNEHVFHVLEFDKNDCCWYSTVVVNSQKLTRINFD